MLHFTKTASISAIFQKLSKRRAFKPFFREKSNLIPIETIFSVKFMLSLFFPLLKINFSLLVFLLFLFFSGEKSSCAQHCCGKKIRLFSLFWFFFLPPISLYMAINLFLCCSFLPRIRVQSYFIYPLGYFSVATPI